jgi:hypothetical protein
MASEKNMDELRAAQQQTAANVMCLQARQQELQRHVSSFQGAHWYSDLPNGGGKKKPLWDRPADTDGSGAGCECRQTQ